MSTSLSRKVPVVLGEAALLGDGPIDDDSDWVSAGSGADDSFRSCPGLGDGDEEVDAVINQIPEKKFDNKELIKHCESLRRSAERFKRMGNIMFGFTVLGGVVALAIILQSMFPDSQLTSFIYDDSQAVTGGKHDVPAGSSDDLVKDIYDWKLGPKPGMRFLSDEEIAYVENGIPHLVILGHVFDVTKGFKSYSPGSGYHGFIGQDGSRAFITGDFTKDGLVNDVEGLSADDYNGLVKWLEFYFETYPFIGYHIGRFFNKFGRETDYMADFKGWVKDSDNVKSKEQDIKKQFPPCNMEWKAESGTRFWCSNKSGGIDRSWDGLPYQFAEDQKSVRCACVSKTTMKDPRIKPYPNCSEDFKSCFVSSTK